ncbi:competence protein ComG [Halobacillus litoralis]|uniref:Competence protein ComG n=1 Tax=Halobacillus litoralis TaxID=45668 RepID=A0A845DQ71_9BACI|nr:competence protein ComG [Halobacillus litoralis]
MSTGRSEKLQGNKGFTLSETLLVLLAWSVLILCLTPIHQSTYESVMETHVIEQFKEDVFLIQHLSMNNHAYHSLRFNADQGYYSIYDSLHRKTIVKTTLPEGWKIEMLTLPHVVYFNQQGTIRKAGTMRLSTLDVTYKITFPFGTSRMRIEEL